MSVLDKAGKRLGDLSEIPDELVRELNIRRNDDLEDQIIAVMRNQYDGFANVDEVLLGLYREFGQIHKRRYILNKMYRMAKNSLIFSVRGKKGVYSTEKVEGF